jgi:hypothetical protein
MVAETDPLTITAQDEAIQTALRRLHDQAAADRAIRSLTVGTAGPMPLPGRMMAMGLQLQPLGLDGQCRFHRHCPRFERVFAPLFSKSGLFL